MWLSSRKVIFFSSVQPDTIDIIKSYNKAFVVSRDEKESGILEGKLIVNAWNTDKSSIDKDGDDILQYVMLQEHKMLLQQLIMQE